MKKLFFSLTAIVLICLSLPGQSANIVFPDDAGVLDVTKPPYNADKTGTTDATAAIQAALSAYPNGSRTIYLPDGIYLISNTLRWPEGSGGNEYKRTMIQGQSKSGTIIKLKDACEGFQNAASRKAMIYTGPSPAQRFRNAIRGITVNTGSGNPGACGIQFNCSNEGTIQHVNIISGDGQGVFGLDLAFTDEIGPGFIYDLTVDGFDVGIRQSFVINSMTFEKINLKNQNVYGFHNTFDVSPIRGFISENSVPAIFNEGASATMVLIDAVLTSDNDTVPAIINTGTLYARNVSRTGYNMTIKSEYGLKINMEDEFIQEYNSHGLFKQFPSPVTSLNLPIKDIPEIPWSELSEWVNVMAFGAVGNGSTDDSKAIQDAIDSGKETVYFPAGYTFKFDDTIRIRGNVKRIIGCEGRLSGNGTLLVEPGNSDTIVIERISTLYSNVNLVNKSERTLVVNSITGLPLNSYGNGDVFLLNYCSSIVKFHTPGQNVWIRQLNLEEANNTNLFNSGANLWLLGYKTERGNVKIHTLNGGKTELLGVHNYSTSGTKVHPWYVVEEASMSIAGSRETNFNGMPYTEYVKEIRNGVSKTIDRLYFPGSSAGASVIPLYTAYEITSVVPAAPQSLSFTQTSVNDWYLDWDSVNDPDFEYYSVYVAESQSGPYFMISNYQKETGYKYTATKFATFYFVVTAVNNEGIESNFSAVYTAPILKPSAPSKPTGLTGYAEESSNFLSWNKNPEMEISHYEIYRAVSPSTFLLLLANNVTDTSYTDNAITAGKIHSYYIRAVNIFNDKSSNSDIFKVFPLNSGEVKTENNHFTVFPNPSSSVIHLKAPVETTHFTAAIIDPAGRTIMQASFEKDSGEMNVRELIQGLYFVKLNSDHNSKVIRISVKR
jgi:hypothetical protein